jgi:hypothetical protein
VEGKKGMSKSVLLCRTTDPEAKRNIIGDTFMTVANRVIAEMNLDPGKVSPLDIFLLEILIIFQPLNKYLP